MIILEGADGVGKTTLAKKLESELGLTYRHLSRLPDQFHRYWDYLPLMNKRFICDRLWLSEYAYCYARDESVDEKYRRLLIAQQSLLGAYTVVITRDSELRYQDKDEMYNKQIITRANIWFLTANDRIYDIDYAIHCTESKPWPDDSDLNHIKEQWQMKQKLLKDIYETRPI